MTEEQEKIIQKLNNWVETCNKYGSIRTKKDENEFVDINDNEFTRFSEIAKNYNGSAADHLMLKFYPEHLEMDDVGIKSNDDIFKEINENFNIETIDGILKFLSDDQIKQILNEENYLCWLTDKKFYEFKDKIERRKASVKQMHEILEKLREFQIPDDLILQIWKFAFKMK